jgi:hypothetical protein
MAGFWGGLFGKRSDSNDAASQNNGASMKSGNSRGFYLDADAAQSFGNTEFMRKPIKIKRTYAKTVGSPTEKVFIQEVSSLKANIMAETGQFGVGSTGSSSSGNTNGSKPSTTNSSSASETRRSGDSSLDMFRSMARDLKKR